jgi:hypothetical protein
MSSGTKCKKCSKHANSGFLRADGQPGARETCGEHIDPGDINLSKPKQVEDARATMHHGVPTAVVARPPQPTTAVLLAAANMEIANLKRQMLTLENQLAAKEVSLQAESKQVTNMLQQILQLQKGQQQQQPPHQLPTVVVKPLDADMPSPSAAAAAAVVQPAAGGSPPKKVTAPPTSAGSCTPPPWRRNSLDKVCRGCASTSPNNSGITSCNMETAELHPIWIQVSYTTLRF